MRTICDQQAINEVMAVLAFPFQVTARIRLSGYVCVHDANRNFYFRKTEDLQLREFFVVVMPDASCWELDKFQLNLGFRKQRVEINGNILEPTDSDDCFIYEKREGGFVASDTHTLENIRSYVCTQRQLECCDVYLLIPGKLEKGDDVWDSIPQKHRDVFTVFRRKIDACIREEFNSHFADELERKCIGELTIEIEDPIEGRTFYQDALAGVVKHSTGICILEITVQNCAVGGNKLLNHYCGNMMHILYEGQRYTADELLKALHIRKYGHKRSMVFSYGDVSEAAIVNALANEEYPMGKICGDFLRKIREQNIAQYDTAEVYVSEETMFEKCAEINAYGNKRLAYHAIEIFFVELILFQDAAVDKVYTDLEEEEKRQNEYRNVETAMARCEEISFDMAQALQFADYDQFNFPTVRLSARNVAACFGLDRIFEKYDTNKTLLETMIQANKRKWQTQQDEVKNRFLFLLSAATTIGMLGDIFYVLYQDKFGGFLSYVAAFVILAVIYGIYKLRLHIIDLTIRKKAGKNNGKST